MRQPAKLAAKLATKLATKINDRHRDLLNRCGHMRKTPLFNMDYNECLTFAENDLKANWQDYKRHFLEAQR